MNSQSHRHRLKIALLSVLFIVLSACGNNGVEVSSYFENSQGIVEGTAVYFNEQEVGKVVDVMPKQQGSFVTLRVNEEVAQNISPKAAVVVNRLKTGAPLEIHNSNVANELGLQGGEKLRGLNSMIELIAWSVGDALEVGSNELSGYVQSFENYLKSDDFQEDKELVKSKVAEITQDTVKALRSAETDISDSIDDLQANEEQLAATIEEFGNEIAPVVKDFASNSARLAAEIERFALALEQQTTAEQETGARLMESLLATMEQINESLEAGSETNMESAPQSNE